MRVAYALIDETKPEKSKSPRRRKIKKLSSNHPQQDKFDAELGNMMTKGQLNIQKQSDGNPSSRHNRSLKKRRIPKEESY